MKRRVQRIRPQRPSKSGSGGKRLLLQTAFCALVLVLVLAVQHTSWSATVQLQISRLFGYEIDFAALGQTLLEQIRASRSVQEETPPTESVSTEPETPPVQEELPQVEPEKWTLLNTGRITSRYGERELDGVVGFHSGIDIAGNYGDDVFAMADGEVFETGVDEGYGNYIKIRHPQKGITTLYGHLQSISVNEGQTVTRGAVIGTVGSTGRSNGPHLHLEVRDGENHTLDPAPYIQY